MISSGNTLEVDGAGIHEEVLDGESVSSALVLI